MFGSSYSFGPWILNSLILQEGPEFNSYDNQKMSAIPLPYPFKLWYEQRIISARSADLSPNHLQWLLPYSRRLFSSIFLASLGCLHILLLYDKNKNMRDMHMLCCHCFCFLFLSFPVFMTFPRPIQPPPSPPAGKLFAYPSSPLNLDCEWMVCSSRSGPGGFCYPWVFI